MKTIFRYIKSNTISFILFALIYLSSSPLAKAQVTWSFKKENTLTTDKAGLTLTFVSRLPSPELVTGFKGTGLRTDGYSTWLTTRIPASKSVNRSINGYFALETYPTDTAGFFAICTDPRNCISACIDRFGKAMIGVNADGAFKYYGSDKIIPKFKWVNIDLQLKDKKAWLKVNGVLITSAPLPDSYHTADADSLIIGRDWRMKSVNIFPVTAINGIIDEISVNSPAGTQFSASVINKLKRSKPVLAVPASRFEGDFNRPKYHLLPAANWTNETHGLIYYRGLYHIFNQKNGANLFLGQMNWGHFTSPDLVSWTEQKPVLTPEQGYDENGIWSGCSVIGDDGKPVIIYTGGGDNAFGMCLAYPADASLNTWKKYAGNPVIPAVPEQFSRMDFHDPYVWKEKDIWYMIIGFGLEDNNVKRGTVLLYRSADLKKWEYLHPMFTGDPDKDGSGVFWEMPVFWKIGSKYILLVNKVPVKGKPALALYWTGSFINEKFVPDEPLPKKLEVINRLLSPSVTHDKLGNTAAIAIIPDETSAKDTYARGWTHLFSIPRVWTLQDGKIKQSPHPALKSLRQSPGKFPAQTIDTTSNMLISKGRHQLEIDVDLLPGSATKFGFVIGKHEQGTELSKIYYDVKKQQLVIDQSRSTLRKYVPLNIRTGDYQLEPGKKVNIHLFIDGSVVEGFINDEDAFTTRLFPLHTESSRVEIFAEGGSLQLLKATTWQLKNSGNKTAF